MRFRQITLAIAITVCAATGQAQTVQDSIVTQLTEQGFTEIWISRTWLGRSRIVARSDELYREIIVNPVTGEILRDYWRQDDGASGNRREILDVGRGDGAPRSSERDDYDDDDDRDDWGSGDDDGGGWGGDGNDGGDSDGGDSDGGGDDD